jgi:alanyl-tRNA synthetase
MRCARTAAGELRTSLEEMPARIASLMDERKKLERDLSDARKKLAMGGGGRANRRGGCQRRARGRKRQADGALG